MYEIILTTYTTFSFSITGADCEEKDFCPDDLCKNKVCNNFKNAECR